MMPDAQPVPLRSHLKELQAALDDASEALLAHGQEHRCQQLYSTTECEESARIAGLVSDAQYQLSMTRFLNEGD